MENDTSSYAYLHDQERLNALDIRAVLEELGCESNGKKVFCPTEHKKGKVKLYISDKNRCTCYDCHALDSASPIKATMHIKDFGWSDACKWLEDRFNIAMIPNPDYRGEPVQYQPRRRLQSEEPVMAQTKTIEYEVFDPARKYVKVDITRFYDKYSEMTKPQKLKMVYTAMYRFAFKTSQKPKYAYYANRGIGAKKAMKKIAYLSSKDYDLLLDELKKHFPEEDLIEFGLVRPYEDGEKTPGEFKLNFIKNGGLLLVPSFDLYSNMVTGFMARPTYPPEWLKKKKIKEFQISKTDLIKPLPFGLTYEMLASDVPFFFVTEGHPDGLALPETIEIDGKTHPVYCVSVPGTDGYSVEMLGLFRGKLAVLAYDQDEAGRIGAHGSVALQSSQGNIVVPDDHDGNKALELEIKKRHLNQEKYNLVEQDGLITKLRKASVIALALKWDLSLGGDVNDVEINGNLEWVIDNVVKHEIEKELAV